MISKRFPKRWRKSLKKINKLFDLFGFMQTNIARFADLFSSKENIQGFVGRQYAQEKPKVYQSPEPDRKNSIKAETANYGRGPVRRDWYDIRYFKWIVRLSARNIL